MSHARRSTIRLLRSGLTGATPMKTAECIASIERQIGEHQQVQMVNPPSSEAWQNASAEINRLAALIVTAAKNFSTTNI